MPDDYKRNVMIAHTSLAGQPGNPHSPRLLFRADRADNGLFTSPIVFSVNGGYDTPPVVSEDGTYPNPDDFEESELQPLGISLEIVLAESGRPLEFFDMHANDSLSMQRNPPLCVGCHSAGNPDGYEELHMIFHADPN